MAFEAEVVPLFIGGCIIVSLLELVMGWFLFQGHKKARSYFVGHVVMMVLALFFLVKCLFGARLGFDLGIASISNSGSIGLFGVFWTFGVLLMLEAVDTLRKDK